MDKAKRRFCYKTRQLSVMDCHLMSDMEYMNKGRIDHECDCDMMKVCSKVCYLLMGSKQEREEAHRLINLIQN